MNELRQLVAFLAEIVSVDDISSRVGPIIPDDHDVRLRPAGVTFSDASISSYPESGEPYTLELELVQPITVGDLRAAFGDYARLRTDRGQPREIIFYPPPSDRPYSVAVIGRIAGDDFIETASVHHVILRRDPR